MKTPLYCDNPVCTNKVGTVEHYDWGDQGCDPPDVYIDPDAVEDESGAYCSEECRDFVNGITEEECEN